MISILNEVKMSPQVLAKQASKVNGTIGFEIEVGIPFDAVGASPIENGMKYKFKSIDDLFGYFMQYNSVEELKELQKNIKTLLASVVPDFLELPRSEQMHTVLKFFPAVQNVLEKFPEIQGPYSQLYASLSEQLQEVTGKRVVFSEKYHGAERKPGVYALEPDPSVSVPKSTFGVEIVSPPMPYSEGIDQFLKITSWLKSIYGVTNTSTGLHFGVSVSNFDQIDYTKLAVFVGDEYVLSQFSRLGNEYAASVEKAIKDSNFATAVAVINRARTKIESANKHYLMNLEDERMSIRLRDGYIEFRSPGGNWLNQPIERVVNTVNRFVYATSIACNPTAYTREYAVKLYQLMQSDAGDASLAKVISGEMKPQEYVIRRSYTSIPVIVTKRREEGFVISDNGKPIAVVYTGSIADSQNLIRLAQDAGVNVPASAGVTTISKEHEKLLNLKNVIRM